MGTDETTFCYRCRFSACAVDDRYVTYYRCLKRDIDLGPSIVGLTGCESFEPA
jgi:hypothetical protein